MIKKRVFSVVLGALLLATLSVPAFAQQFAMPSLSVPCRAAILVEANSGTVLFEKQADTPMPIASITKVMTLILAMEAVEQGRISLQDTVPVSEHAYNMGGSQIWLEPGEVFTLDEMIKAICVCSANDAAVAVAEFVGGSEPAFVEMMNQRAKELGMNSTHFENACGLDKEGHLSTARDVALMSQEVLLHHPLIMEYTGIWMETLRGGQTHLVNTNKLLKRYEGITGLKTGTTNGAGICITATATRNNLSLIAVVLGSDSSSERFAAATTLLDYGFATFAAAVPPMPQSAPQFVQVTGGSEETVGVCYQLPPTVLVKKGEENNVTTEVRLPESIPAPVQQGQKLGSVVLRNGQETVGEWEITAAETVPQMTVRLAFERMLQALLQH